MLKRVFLLGAALTVMAGSLLAQKPAYQMRGNVNYEPQVVRVKFKAEVTQQLDAIMAEAAKDGMLQARGKALQVGIAGFDAASAETGALEMKRVFRPAGKFEARHRQWGLHLWYEIKIAPGQNLQQALNRFGKATEVVLVEPKEVYRLVDGYDPATERTAAVANYDAMVIPGGTPNDPSYNNQWGWPAVDAAQAWELETGHSSVVVAIEDQGVDYNHPDLDGNMWTNSGETPGNGIDDDNNGYVDDYYGYNFGNDNGNIAIDYHGTHVGGTVAAETNNGVGVSGAAGGSGSNDGVRLMSLSVFGNGAQAGFDEAFIYAADMGAAISQNSWGGGGQSAAMENAIDYFRANGGGSVMDGGLVVFAAGNDNSSSASLGYPGSYASCLAVASVTSSLARSSFSNYGSWVDIAAPGSAIYSTYPVSQGSYNSISGTSMACPHVSGIAALVVSNKFRNGEIITDEDLWGILTGNVTNIDAQNPSYIGQLGSGLVNAYSALTGEVPPPPPPPPCYEGSGDVTLTLLTDNYASETSWVLSDTTGATIASGSGYANNTTYTETFTGLVGKHTFTINDSYGDGICCGYGNGSYSLTDANGTVLVSGGAFGSTQSTDICISQDGGGGSTEIIHEAGFESGWDGWNDGGADVARRRDSTRAYDGEFSIRIRDNSGDASAMTLSGLDLSGYASVEFNFFFYAFSMENNEDFFLQYNSGSGWVTVNSWARGTDFNNNGFYEITETVNADLTSNAAFRLMCDASGNKDHIYIDEVTITGSTATSSVSSIALISESIEMEVQAMDYEVEFGLYPNPASNFFTINLTEDQGALTIYRLNGQAIRTMDITAGEKVDVADLPTGLYIISVVTDGEVYTERFIKK